MASYCPCERLADMRDIRRGRNVELRGCAGTRYFFFFLPAAAASGAMTSQRAMVISIAMG